MKSKIITRFKIYMYENTVKKIHYTAFYQYFFKKTVNAFYI